MKMPWGKYGPRRGRMGFDIAYISSSYLRWILRECLDKLTDDQTVEIEKELKYRDDNDAHFYKDKIQIKG